MLNRGVSKLNVCCVLHTAKHLIHLITVYSFSYGCKVHYGKMLD